MIEMSKITAEIIEMVGMKKTAEASVSENDQSDWN